MKTMTKVMIITLILVLFAGCASKTKDPKTRPRKANDRVIGAIETTVQHNGRVIGVSADTYNAAYEKMLEMAKEEHGEEVDITDMSVTFNRWTGFFGGRGEYKASGNIVALGAFHQM